MHEMLHEFQLNKEISIESSPEAVWNAISTGPGIDSWFMGRSKVEPGAGGTVTTELGGFAIESTVTAYEPPAHFGYKSNPAPDGSFMAFEYLIEGRAGGSTTLRLVQSGMMGDNWEAEYEALNTGWDLYLHTLSEYLAYFPGRSSVAVGGQAGPKGSEQEAWDVLVRSLGLPESPAEGDKVQFTVDGVAPVEGVIDIVNAPFFVGVRTDDALYRFSGRGGGMGIGHHLFAEVSQQEAEQVWQAWLTRAYA
jgi:uncharacterized protein YndB with AHSA1/START domain